ncbi:hypothetical protein BH11BAC2_BH11BAC2_08600 [soil metagenome]
MKRINTLTAFFTFLFIIAGINQSKAQCTWTTQFYDGFEYTTPCPDILPNTVFQTSPQTYAVRTGARSLYANFINCNGGTGTCAGDQYYERIVPVCAGLPIRFSAWFTTSFAGTQCDVRIDIVDSSGIILSTTPNLVAPYAPTWTQYTSGTLNPTSSYVILKFYTNVDGGNGNDLSMDDLLLEQCLTANTHSFTVGYVCNNLPVVNLFNVIPGIPVTTGTWSGSSVLTGGYLGSFTPSVNTGGSYIYTSLPYGNLPGCPTAKDTVLAIKVNAPISQLVSDTTICTNQTVTLNPLTSLTFDYLWSTGDTTGTIVASSAVTASLNYNVTITDVYGCVVFDTAQVNFVVCNSIEETGNVHLLDIFPNPTSNQLHLKFINSVETSFDFVLIDINGKEIFSTQISPETQLLSLPNLPEGMYLFSIGNASKNLQWGKLIISK